MNDLTQQRMAEYEAFLIDINEKLKVSDPIYSVKQLFNNSANFKMSEILGAGESEIDYELEIRLKQLRDRYSNRL